MFSGKIVRKITRSYTSSFPFLLVSVTGSFFFRRIFVSKETWGELK